MSPRRARYVLKPHVSVSAELHDRISAYAAAHGQTMSSVVEQACSDLPVLVMNERTATLLEAHARSKGLTVSQVVELAVEVLR